MVIKYHHIGEGMSIMFENFKAELKEVKSYPKYLQLRDQLEEYIRANAVAPGEQLPDIVSMCRISGLSNRSVERAYIMLISDGVCFRRPKKGTFVRGDVPLRGELKPRICAIFDPRDPMRFEKDDITGRIYNGIQREAHRKNIDLLILSERSLPVYLDKSAFELVGVIMLSWFNREEATRVVAKYPDVKFIFLNYHFEGFEEMPENACGIFNDDFAGGFEAADYLISRGKRNLRAIALRLEDDNYERRLDGFLEAVKMNRLPLDERRVCRSGGRNVAKDEQFVIGRELLQEILDADPSVDGIFCANDLLASGVAAALEKRGLRNRVEVVGYDNILPYLSANGRFGTVAINLELMGERAIGQLAEPGSFACPRIINIPPRLMPRTWREEEN